MSEYQLQIKQVVDYPRCRIYKQFAQSLMADRSIRAGGGSGLFYFMVLCSYADFRTHYHGRQEAIKILSSILWGYISKESKEILEKFVQETGSGT